MKGEGDTNRIVVPKPRVGMVLPGGGSPHENIYTAPGSVSEMLVRQYTQYEKQTG